MFLVLLLRTLYTSKDEDKEFLDDAETPADIEKTLSKRKGPNN
jgi:hypothetical protein